MHVLATGATGFVGLNILEALLQGGHDVAVYLRPGARRRYLDGFPVRVVEGDLRDILALHKAMAGREAVIHTAGNTSTRWKDLPELEAVNVQGTRAVRDAALLAGIPRLVYTSTTATLQSHRGEGGDGAAPVRGFRRHSPYARTKAEAEELVLEHPGGLVLNPAEVIGPYDHTLQWGRMVLAVAGGRVPFIPTGGGTFSPARDVAAAHVAALTRGRPGQRYVLGGHDVDFPRFLALIGQETGRPVEPLSRLPYPLQAPLARLREWGRPLGFPQPPVDAFRTRVFGGHHYFADGPARRDLGYAPRPLAEAIAECHRWYLDHGFLPREAPNERARP